jgi:hypothetical protein
MAMNAMPSGGFAILAMLLYRLLPFTCMAQATCRVTDELDTAIDEAAAEAGLFRSEVMRRALLHYVETNPDGLEAFAADPTTPDRATRRTYDPTDEL